MPFITADILLETTGALLVAVILGRFAEASREEPIRQHAGWSSIFIGTALVFIALLFDISDNFESLNRFILLGGTATEAFIEKATYNCGYLLLALGFFKWMPSISQLSESKRLLNDQHQRLETILNSIEEIIYVADLTTHELIFVNDYAKQIFGDLNGQLCWQSFHQDQHGPCQACPDQYRRNPDGKPREVYTREVHNILLDRWFRTKDRAIVWIDGRTVKIGIAIDITRRKKEEEEKTALLKDLQDSLSKVKMLSGLLPICAACKKIRDDKGYWQQIEGYIRKNSEAEFSHSICPQCAKEYYPNEYNALYGDINPPACL